MYKTFFNTPLTSNSDTALEELGALRLTNDATNRNRLFKYIQANADTTISNGTVTGFSDSVGVVVTSDISDINQNRVAGVGIGTVTASYYGWIQVGGYHSAIKTAGDDDITIGMNLIMHGTTDGTCGRLAVTTAPTCTVLGYAVDSDVDASDTVAGYITLWR